MSDQFTPQEQFLIEQLRRAPQTELNPATLETIRLRILDALDSPPTPAPQPSIPVTTLVVVAAAVIIIATLLIMLTQRGVPAAEIPAPSATPTATSTPTLTPSPTPSMSPSPTPSPSPVLSGTATATAAGDTVMIIEGEIESINGNIVTIFGVEIEILPDDPVLATIHVGDVIHVEGSTVTTGGTVIIIATSHIQPESTAIPASGDSPPSETTWTDDGTCLHPPPPWAPANGWRRRCEGAEKEKNDDKGNNGKGKNDDD